MQRGKQGGNFRGRRGEGRARAVQRLLRIEKTQHNGVYRLSRRQELLVTKSLVKEESAVEEKVFDHNVSREGAEYRVWSVIFSPVAGGLLRMERLSSLQFGCNILCLCPGQDTAPYHFSDIVGDEGRVYMIEASHKYAQMHARYAQRRHNLVPLYANSVSQVQFLLPMVDLLYCSSLNNAEDDQSRGSGCTFEEFEQSALLCLKQNGHCLVVFGADQPASLPSDFDILQRIPLPESKLLCPAVYRSIRRFEPVVFTAPTKCQIRKEEPPISEAAPIDHDELEEGEIVDDD